MHRYWHYCTLLPNIFELLLVVYQAAAGPAVLALYHAVLQYSTVALLLGTMPSNFAKLLLETETE